MLHGALQHSNCFLRLVLGVRVGRIICSPWITIENVID
jgi:hypothetical protein